MALHALGKLHAALAQKKGSLVVAPESKAMVFYQAALLVYPNNYMAANDLGVLLAQCGQLYRRASNVRTQLGAVPAVDRMAEPGGRVSTTGTGGVGRPGRPTGDVDSPSRNCTAAEFGDEQ